MKATSCDPVIGAITQVVGRLKGDCSLLAILADERAVRDLTSCRKSGARGKRKSTREVAAAPALLRVNRDEPVPVSETASVSVRQTKG
jgi:hypothetical protein